MPRRRGPKYKDFVSLREAIAQAEEVPPRSIEERALLWEQALPVLPQERSRHGIAPGDQVATLDEILSLAHAIPLLSKAERTVYFAFVSLIDGDLRTRRALVRRARREGWIRLARMAAQATPPEVLDLRPVLGLVLPLGAAKSGRLLDSWLLSDDAFLHEVGERGTGPQPQSELSAAWQALAQVQPVFGVPGIALGEADIDLALSWVSAEHQQAVHHLLSRDGRGRLAALAALSWNPNKKLFGELHRCLAARHAELLVAHLLRAWGAAVEDVSLLATTGPGDKRWETHDLEIDGRPVDVKNVTFDRQERQSWAQIKRFRAAVRYDAVRTRWLSSLRPFLDPDTGADAEYLGSVNQQELAAFRSMARPPLSLEIEEPILSGRSKFAGWCFALPLEAYAAWDAAFARFVRAIELAGPERPLLTAPQLALLRARGVKAALRPEEVDSMSSLGSIGRVADAVAQFGRSPRVLVAALLNELQAHIRGEGLFARSLVRDLLPFGHRVPLGALDPSKSVAAFLGTLLRLVETPGALDGIVSVRLMSPRWLRGTAQEGFPVTLITNCLHCSEYPLIRGQAPACPHGTGRLVCPNGHCC